MPETAINVSPILTREDVMAREARRRKLLHRLDASRATIRLEAIEECQRLSPHEIGTLALLSDRADEWRFPDRFQYAVDAITVMVASVSVVAVIYGLTFFEFALFPNIDNYLTIWTALAAVCLVVHSSYQKNRYSVRVQESLRQVVATTQNPDIFPVLMQMLQITVYTYQREFLTDSETALYEAASRWLLRLSTEQIRAYAIRHQALNFFLSPHRARVKPELTLRVLHILKEVGTASDIPVVMALTRVLPRNDKTMRDAAQDCLTVLQERERQSRQPEILLRASCAPAAQTDILLLPASAPPPAPETLLRPLIAQTVAAAPEQLLRPSTIQE